MKTIKRFRRWAGGVVTAGLAVLLLASPASAYLNVQNAGNACYAAALPTANTNLAPWGGPDSGTSFEYTRAGDRDVTIDMRFYSGDYTTTFDASTGTTVYWYLTDRVFCHVVGDNPGTVTSVTDWGVAYRRP